MACAATGQLTAAEFEQAVRLFVDWWQAVASSSSVQQLCWSLECAHMPVTGQVIAYAQLERVVSASSAEQQQQQQHMRLPSPAAAAADDELHLPQQRQQQLLDAALPMHLELDTEDDEAAVSLAPAARAAPAAADVALSNLPRAQQQQHLHQYSIVYYDTYRVPVLFLKASEPDGRPLSLSRLLQELPALQLYREASQADWTFITQVEHPLQRVPCFMLHPCQTAARMQLLLQEQRSFAQAAAAAEANSSVAGQEASITVLASGNRLDGQCLRLPEYAAAAAAAEGFETRGGSMQCGGEEHNALTGNALLLLYMRAWFSMVAGLLGFDMLSLYDGDA